MNFGLIEINASLYVLTLAIYWLCKRQVVDVGFFILSIYSLCSILSASLYRDPLFVYSWSNDNPLILIPFLYQYVVLMLFISPILLINFSKIDIVESVPPFWFKHIAWGLFFLSLVSIFVTAPLAFKSMFVDIVSSYEQAYEGELILTKNPIFSSMILLNKVLRVTSIFLFFYSLCIDNLRKYSILLFVPAYVTVLLSSLASASRGVMVYIIWDSILAFCIFQNLIPNDIKKKLKRIIIVMLVFFGLIFGVITLARFSDNEDYSVVYLAKHYVGESFINFNNSLWQDQRGTTDGNNCFPWIRKILMLDHRMLDYNKYIENEGARINLTINVFYSFIGDLVIDFGRHMVLGFAAIFFFLQKKVLSISNVLTLKHILLLSVLAPIYAEGVFFFTFQNINQVIVLNTFLYIYFYFSNKKIVLHTSRFLP